MKIISLGWGVQSFTLAAMVALGELEPIDAAVHSDTGFESTLTYEFAKRWTPWLEAHGVKVETVKGTNGDLSELFQLTKSGKQISKIPAFTTNDDGSRAIGRRQCTTEWKISPLRRWLQEHRENQRVEQWIGISLDEIERTRVSDVKYISNRYPLIEKRMTRSACILWLGKNGIEVPPKSACIFCPYHNKAQWQIVKATESDWELAKKVDELMRLHGKRPNYLTAYLVPITELDLSTQEENGQMTFFDCSGTCWL